MELLAQTLGYNIGQNAKLPRLYFEEGRKYKAFIVGYSAVGDHIWEPTNEEHKQFLEYIRQKDRVVNLQHPIYGNMRGRIKSSTISHDSRPYFKTIALSFKEELQINLDGNFSLMQGMFSLMDSGFKGIEKSFADNLAPAIAEKDRQRVLRALCVPELKFITQINKITSVTRSVLTALDQSVSNITAFMDSIISPLLQIRSNGQQIFRVCFAVV